MVMKQHEKAVTKLLRHYLLFSVKELFKVFHDHILKLKKLLKLLGFFAKLDKVREKKVRDFIQKLSAKVDIAPVLNVTTDKPPKLDNPPLPIPTKPPSVSPLPTVKPTAPQPQPNALGNSKYLFPSFRYIF